MGCTSSQILPDSDDVYKPKEVTKGSLLRGDVATKAESRNERERKMKEKQIQRTSAAEELCGRILEEKERLSINSKSRATSVTSRPTSPSVDKKKHVQFRKEEKLQNVKEKSVTLDSREHMVNGSVASSSGVVPVIMVQSESGETCTSDKPKKSKSTLMDSKSG